MPRAPDRQTHVRLPDRLTSRLADGAPVALIADTHLPKGSRGLPEACARRISAAALVVHAGDVSRLAALERIEAIETPLFGVHGNVDEPAVRERLPEAIEIEIGPRRLAVVHDSGAKDGRIERLRRWFEDADAVVFGHSHLPLHESAPDGFQIFNPGSPTERRRAPAHTMGELRLRGGELVFELIEL